jgi:hypothetical protein
MSTLLQICREKLRCDPDAGTLHWIASGKRAGYPATKGYRQVRIDGRAYMEHRIIWLMSTGEMPKQQIDHRNEIKDDNRFKNLRDVSQGVNQGRGAKASARNKSTGVRGVFRDFRCKRTIIYRAMIRIDQKLIVLGNFRDIDLAKAAYEQARANCGRT